jgi:hypothetical protein
MDIKSFRVENGELTVVIAVADQRAALNMLQTLLYTKVDSLNHSGRVVTQVEVVDAEEAREVLRQYAESVEPVAVKPSQEYPRPGQEYARPAPIAESAPATATAAPAKRGPGRPRKVQPAVPVPVAAELAVALAADEPDDLPPELVEAIAAAALAEEAPEDQGDDTEESSQIETAAAIAEEDQLPEPPPPAAPRALHAVPNISVVKPLLKTGDTEVLIAKLVEFTKLRDVLYTLKDSGYTTADQIADMCEEIQAEVPTLSRITGIRDRVHRAVKALGI